MTHHHFRLPSTISESATLAARVRAICVLKGGAASTADAIELCAIEGFNNAVEHAHDSDPTRVVEVTVEFLDGVVNVAIQDTGRSMPPGKLEAAEMPIPDPKDPTTWSDRGRGLAIIKTLMDSVTYESSHGKNTLRFRKRL